VAQNDVVETLAQSPGLNRYELSKLTGSHHHVIARAVDKLEADHEVTKIDDGLANTGHTKYVYELTEKGFYRAILLGVPFNKVSHEYQTLYESVRTWVALDRILTKELGKTWTLSKNKFFQQMAAIIRSAREFGDTRLEMTLSGFLADFLKNSLKVPPVVSNHIYKRMKNDPVTGPTTQEVERKLQIFR